MLRASCQISLVLSAGCQAAKPLGSLGVRGQLWVADLPQKSREKPSARPICPAQHQAQQSLQDERLRCASGCHLPAAQPNLSSAPRLPESSQQHQHRQLALQTISSLMPVSAPVPT